jgi:hypothetical protein
MRDIKFSIGNGKSDKLPIQEFTFDMFAINPALVMIAKRGSGKSVVVKALLEYFKDVPCGIIVSPTEKMNSFYGNFFPETYIHYEYKSETIQRVLMRQQMIIKKQKLRKSEGKSDIDARAFIIMDDCLASKGKWVRDQPIRDLFFNGRHFQVMYILTMQQPLGITPELRSNFDYIFLLAEDFISNLKKIYEHYAGMFPNFDAFRQVFAQLTADFGSMVISNRGARSNLFEKIFYYKAPYSEDDSDSGLQFGCKQFRDFHKNNYDSEWQDREKDIDVEKYLADKKRNKSSLVVDKIKHDSQSDKK